MGFRIKLREHAHLHYLYQKIAAIENGKGGDSAFGAGNQCLYCPFWARGSLDNTSTHMNPVAPSGVAQVLVWAPGAEQGRGVLSVSAPEIGAYIVPFGTVVP